MIPIIGMSYSELKKMKVLFGSGKGLRLQTSPRIPKQKFEEMIIEAHKIKKERKEAKFRSGIISRMKKRGIVLPYKLSYSTMDSNDIVGLIGEITTQDYVSRPEYDEVFIKWRRSGTSKSKGIDLVIHDTKNDDLILLEAKNSHFQIAHTKAEQVIKTKLEDALNQFEHEKTLISLTNLVSEISESRDTIRATGVDVTELDKLCKFINSKINFDSYKIHAFMIIDKNHSDDSVFTSAMSKINSSADLGTNRDILLHLIEIEDLDAMTAEILSAYV